MTGEDTDRLVDPELERRLRRGLALLAEETPAARTRLRYLVGGLAAAAVLAVGSLGTAGLLHRGQPATSALPPPSRAVVSTPSHTARPPSSPATDTAPAQTLAPPPNASGITYNLTRLVKESQRIVVGTVTTVRRGSASEATGGLPYVLATVRLDHVIRGEREKSLVAFDYSYGATTSLGSPQGAKFHQGERVLLFLSSSGGTVHAGVSPLHWQVTGGRQGKYVMNGSEPVAAFTLQKVEAVAAR